VYSWWYKLKNSLFFSIFLGFDPLPRKLAEISGFEEDFIIEVCFSKPLKKKV
jgi:hypothetical protein